MLLDDLGHGFKTPGLVIGCYFGSWKYCEGDSLKTILVRKASLPFADCHRHPEPTGIRSWTFLAECGGATLDGRSRLS